jgi:hypothetical protein
MTKTEVKRAIRCTESTGKQTAYGVLCRAVEYEGGHLVCLINVAASPREVSLDLNGKPVKSAVDLFDNKSVKTKTINIQPLTVRLFKVSK